MTVGLPGTGIGGVFYMLLAVYMPIREFFRMARRQTNVARWCLIGVQVGFVAGIIAGIWAEVWVLGQLLLWLQRTVGLDFLAGGVFIQPTFRYARLLTLASACGSLISLGFVFVVVRLLRYLLRRQGLSKGRLPLVSKKDGLLCEAA